MAELVGGAVVSAFLRELILFAKRANRCKNDCKNLVGTCKSIDLLLTYVDNSSDLGNSAYQAWLQDLHTLLVQAQGIVEDCVVKRSILSFNSVNRWYLSSKIQDIHRRIAEKNIQLSHDVLGVDIRKCFLYFAAFPEGYDIPTKELYSIWHAEGLFGSHDVEETSNIGRMNLITLANRSLIDLDVDGEHAKVHDVMRDLAICIIRDANSGDWAHECQFEPGKLLETLPKIKETTKRVSFVGTHVKNFGSQMCESNHNLEVCILSSLTFDDGSGFPIGLPRDFFLGMRPLLYLSLRKCSNLEELPESIKELESLIHLDLSECCSLERLPESIKELKCVTHLDLSGCTSLVELPESIKEVKSLTHLNLSWCRSLKKLPQSIMELISLTDLVLSGCEYLKELSEGIKGLKSLIHLDLSQCWSLEGLPESIKELKLLTHLDLSRCESLKRLPKSIKELKSLTHLDLSGCWLLEEVPESIKELKSLTHLDLSWCESLERLPKSIKDLKSLTHLKLNQCMSLKELPEDIKEFILLHTWI